MAGSDCVRVINILEAGGGSGGGGGQVCVIEPDENSIRRQNSRKPLTEQQTPSSVPNSNPNITGLMSNNSKKKDENPKSVASGGSDRAIGKAAAATTTTSKFRRGLVYSRNKLFSTEFKLLIQFLVIFLSYFVYSISNIILTYQLTVTTDNRWDKDLLKVFRLMIWSYHLVNPIIFLSFHPIFLNKFFKGPDGFCCRCF